MKILRGGVLAIVALSAACQANKTQVITIIDGDQARVIQSTEDSPRTLLAAQPNDRALVNGAPVSLDSQLPSSPFAQLQLIHSAAITIHSPQGAQTIQTSARTVGEALTDAGIQLFAADVLDPPASTPINGSIDVNFTPARELTIFDSGNVAHARSAARTVGSALSEVGIPLLGLDLSSPSENDPIPSDGKIRIVHIDENVNIAFESIPFATQVIDAPQLPVGQQQTITPGADGLAMVRTRVRRQDGKVVSRVIESRTLIRSSVTRVVKSGSQVALQPVPANGVPDQYWLALQMFATVYSPCQSGTGGCSYSTASGAPAGKGIVAVDYSIYSYLAGMRVYIPGYGTATIGDTGGGPIIETKLGVPRTRWIDLGFDEGKIVDMTGWVTVYFLAPAPAEIPYFLK